jgi:pimeloyl-ACP methyl ester carboxylesterase
MEELSNLVDPCTGIREFYVQTMPQVALRAIEFTPSSPGNFPVVVFVAGWVTQISAWKEVLQEMTRDFRVIYLETREKISSRIQGRVKFDVESIGKDIVVVVDHLELAEQSFLLFGSSLGATAIADCVRFLNRQPLCLVLVGPNAHFRVPRLGKWGVTPFYPGLYLLIKPIVKWYLRTFRLDVKHDYAQYEKYCQALDAADPFKLKPALLALSTYEIWPYLSHIKCSSLIFGAEMDKLHEPENLYKIVSSLPNCQYIDLHTNQGTHSREVVEHLRKFLLEIKQIK